MKKNARAQTKISSGTRGPPLLIDSMFHETLHSDYNYIRQDNKCVPAGPEPIPAGVCADPTKTYMGSSGWSIIPGNTCDRERGIKKDQPQEKSCEKGERSCGAVATTIF